MSGELSPIDKAKFVAASVSGNAVIIKRINLPAMEHKDVHGMLYDIMNDGQRKFYEENLECDFSFEIQGLARFRVNAFNQNRGSGAVFRTIPSKVLSMEDLGMGEVFKAEHRRMKRPVVVKILHEHALKSTVASRRFQREVEAAAVPQRKCPF